MGNGGGEKKLFMKQKSSGKNINRLFFDYRQSIDNMDGAFMFLLSERMRVVLKVNLLKKKHSMPVDKTGERISDIKKIFILARELNINESLINSILHRIFHEARILMDDILLKGDNFEDDEDYDTSIEDLRKTLLYLDSAFCYLLAERFRLVEKVGKFKGKHNIKPFAPNRWQEVLESKSKMARELGIRIDLVCDILDLIHEEALRIENEIIH